jgi:succinate-semialdehyde dehydrogenase/glutarate-semialdehyde dehydrogenase
MTLQDPMLLRQAAVIGGKRMEAHGTGLAASNPATAGLIGHVPNPGAAETRAAIEAARLAQPAWVTRTATDRSQILRHGMDDFMELESLCMGGIAPDPEA